MKSVNKKNVLMTKPPIGSAIGHAIVTHDHVMTREYELQTERYRGEVQIPRFICCSLFDDQEFFLVINPRR